MNVCRSLPEIVSALKPALLASSRYLIGIDGIDGSGKSTLGKALSIELQIPLLSLDDFLERDRGLYLPFLRYDEIRQAIERSPQAIVEGVCLLAALANLGARADINLYIKRVSAFGHWYDEDEYDPSGPDGEPILPEPSSPTYLKSVLAVSPHLPGLREEIIQYHLSYRPARKANILYHIAEE